MVRIRRWALAAITAALATWLVAGGALAADSTVSIANFAFDPDTVTIQVGDTITWTNNDGTAHTATAGDGSFNTGNIGPGASDSVTFDTAGSFAYHCAIHPQMTGTVVVQGAAPTPAPTPAPTAPTSEPSGGGGVTITPAPTDTLAAAAADEDRAAWAVAFALAALGVVMLVGTVVADRRFRARDRR
jgi:plastocyanin